MSDSRSKLVEAVDDVTAEFRALFDSLNVYVRTRLGGQQTRLEALEAKLDEMDERLCGNWADACKRIAELEQSAGSYNEGVRDGLAAHHGFDGHVRELVLAARDAAAQLAFDGRSGPSVALAFALKHFEAVK